MDKRKIKSGDRILIAGLGKTGLAVFDFFEDSDITLFAYDAKRREDFDAGLIERLETRCEKCWLGEFPEESERFDRIVISPGISPSSDFIKAAVSSGAELVSEPGLAFENSKADIVAITGTNGKTTTTALVGVMLEAEGIASLVAGNIGVPVISKVKEMQPGSFAVVELSSFQLEIMRNFSPKVAVLLNLTPDHLDRHGSYEAYCDAKSEVFKGQGAEGVLVYNADDKDASRIAEGSARSRLFPFSHRRELRPGVCLAGDKVVLFADENSEPIGIIAADDIRIPGSHNLGNAMAAIGAAYFCGVSAKTMNRVLKTFAGVEHRMETVRTRRGVTYINDSKGTNPDSSIKALLAIKSPVLLIAGGYEKNSDFGEFTDMFEGRVKRLLLIGATAPGIKDSAVKSGFPEEKISVCDSLAECVGIASEEAAEGDVVLLSPACASWGMYENFEKRGEEFKSLVMNLED